MLNITPTRLNYIYIPIWTIIDYGMRRGEALGLQIYIPIWTIIDMSKAKSKDKRLLDLHSNMDDYRRAQKVVVYGPEGIFTFQYGRL